MKRLLLTLISFVLIIVSCQSIETELDPITEEHAAFFGTWEEQKMDKEEQKTTWTFDRYEVKWNGFSHFYKVSGDSLIISGMVYRILDQSEKEIKIVKLNGKPGTLIRKE
ncbi:MAG: hypothetical protein HRT58_15945 [Crocinitomicaceae bacterium]|nr:hypothetical protein [Flavobacteriales bacterium]NQZ37162.1 hypothetical protein [Crocinitomicaceae bacterium]